MTTCNGAEPNVAVASVFVVLALGVLALTIIGCLVVDHHWNIQPSSSVPVWRGTNLHQMPSCF